MRGALHSIEDTLGPVSEFTAMIDERSIPRALKFLVEPEKEPSRMYPPVPDSTIRL